MVNIHIQQPVNTLMKISPIILLLGLGVIVLPETIITIPLFPFGRTEAALVPINNDSHYTYTETVTDASTDATTPRNNQSTDATTQPIERILFGESRTMRAERRSSRRRGAEPPRNPQDTAVGGLECAACEYLANGINQTLLHNPKVIAFVTADIERVCSVLPESVQAMCNDAAQSVAPLLLNHLGDFIVTEGCQDLGVCH